MYDEGLRPSGLRGMQFQILMTIRGHSELSISQLTRIVTLDQTTATRSMALIEKNGWVERVEQADRRLRVYQLSKEGQAVLEVAMPLWSALQQRVLEEVGAEAWVSARGPMEALWKLAIRVPDQCR